MKELINKAIQAKKFSYSPYSKFSVGAALLTANGKIYTGCNIENASFSPTVCAERTAFIKAVSEGERKFSAIAIVGDTDSITPCGVCRQFISEFCNENFKIICAKDAENYKSYTLEELLPDAFKLGENL